MLAERLEQHDVPVWLVNTGWTGGPYGIGERMSIDHTRTMVRAALSGALDGVPFETDPVFGVEVPTTVPGRAARAPAPARHLAGSGRVRRQGTRAGRHVRRELRDYADGVSAAVRAAGPRVEGGATARRRKVAPEEAPTD